MDRMRLLLTVLFLGIFCCSLQVSAGDVQPRAQFGAKSLRVEPAEAENNEAAEWPPIHDNSLSPVRQSAAPIPLVRNSSSRSSETGGQNTNAPRGSGAGLGTLLGSLVCVVVVLLGVAKLISRKNPFAVPGLPRDAVEILGRRTVDPRNSVYLVKVGGKVLLLGASSNGLAPLGEISDPIEVATLVNVSRAREPHEAGVGDWLNRLTGRNPETDQRSFGERLGEQLFQEAEKNGNRLSSISVRSPSEGRHGS